LQAQCARRSSGRPSYAPRLPISVLVLSETIPPISTGPPRSNGPEGRQGVHEAPRSSGLSTAHPDVRSTGSGSRSKRRSTRLRVSPKSYRPCTDEVPCAELGGLRELARTAGRHHRLVRRGCHRCLERGIDRASRRSAAAMMASSWRPRSPRAGWTTRWWSRSSSNSSPDLSPPSEAMEPTTPRPSTLPWKGRERRTSKS
jgi:hypothetical protein